MDLYESQLNALLRPAKRCCVSPRSSELEALVGILDEMRGEFDACGSSNLDISHPTRTTSLLVTMWTEAR